MNVTRGKLVLALAGVMVFFVSTRTGLDVLRWIGIGLVAVAWLLRFVRPRGGGSGPAQGPSM